MVAIAPVPLDEADRLAALHSYQILDTPPDERFDLFTRLCTWVYHVPFAAINLVDADRTFFKSLTGIAPYRPDRATSICAHAVGGGGTMMVVEDLAKDERFQDHPLVAKGMRFYAGALLRAHSGQALGTLCIGDLRPRTFPAEDRDKLLELAKGVGGVLDLHRGSLQLLRMATEDALTGLYNRRAFMDQLQLAFQRAQAGDPCVLLCLDLDGFKQVNDTYGHAAGDALLREVAHRLTTTVRLGDIVARLGGDEFAVLLHRASTPACAEALAQRVLDAFARRFEFEGANLRLSTSIGIAAGGFGAGPADPNDLLRCADAALYEAKHSGPSQYRVSHHRRTALLHYGAQ